ncbi:E3 ubiquitin/ISG15 ligase TRIM25-like [Erpetoichthys calabaricus]|uniref:E3 ubiquitin/ISG15 ligase TRIM25-like n=1 Tax=Erpetoichthys calabaricus TaxID=27687 RepID=A0A8C4T1Y1_ERPCA|nr:E3 ubiquitin/ISG15 ligase TRIM25-like [Erpetoichthys calabaricus]
MMAVIIVLPQDHFVCALCLETLKEPVTIPCGHNYCLKCIRDCWQHTQQHYRCPQCTESFFSKPTLSKNPLLADILEKLKAPEHDSTLPGTIAGPGDVPCDVCSERKQVAIQTCLTCLASYCETHLQTHQECEALKKHKLDKPTRNLQQRICSKHNSLLEIYCKTDQCGICHLCVVTEHKNHTLVMSDTEREEKQVEVKATLLEVKRRLNEREKKLSEITAAMAMLRISASMEIQETENRFSDLRWSIERTCWKLTEQIREVERKEIEKAEAIKQQLEKESEELERGHTELSELLKTDDDIQFLKNFSSFYVIPGDEDALRVTVDVKFSAEDQRKEMSHLKEYLDKISQWKFEKCTQYGSESPVFILQP